MVVNWPQCRRFRFNPWVGKILWRRKRQPTPVLLPGKSHRRRRRSLGGCSPWGGKETDTTEQLHFDSASLILTILSLTKLLISFFPNEPFLFLPLYNFPFIVSSPILSIHYIWIPLKDITCFTSFISFLNHSQNDPFPDFIMSDMLIWSLQHLYIF